MKTRFHFTIVILLLITGLARAGFESDVIDLVNAERTAQGLKPLNYDPDLAAAARLHSRDYFNHDSLDGTKFYERIIDEGSAYNLCGENIAAGSATPEAGGDRRASADHSLTQMKPDQTSRRPGWPASAPTH